MDTVSCFRVQYDHSGSEHPGQLLFWLDRYWRLLSGHFGGDCIWNHWYWCRTAVLPWWGSDKRVCRADAKRMLALSSGGYRVHFCWSGNCFLSGWHPNRNQPRLVYIGWWKQIPPRWSAYWGRTGFFADSRCCRTGSCRDWPELWKQLRIYWRRDWGSGWNGGHYWRKHGLDYWLPGSDLSWYNICCLLQELPPGLSGGIRQNSKWNYYDNYFRSGSECCYCVHWCTRHHRHGFFWYSAGWTKLYRLYGWSYRHRIYKRHRMWARCCKSSKHTWHERQFKVDLLEAGNYSCGWCKGQCLL